MANDIPPPTCPQCGAQVDGSSRGQACSRCLAAIALAELTSESDGPVAAGFPSSPPLATLGSYTLLEEIARGGMGVVYRARQPGLNRDVAVKVILAGPFAGRDSIARFRTEAEAAARLRHPNIVTVHEVGETGGHHWLSMDYVAGPTLAALTAKGPLPARLAARYLRAVADAVEHAHRHGVIHRDLKPGNVLIDRDDQPRVTDFGLAKQLDRDDSPTLTGQALGTPGFAAPEQLSPKFGTVDGRSDVYGMGALLYHMLTGRPPFLTGSAAETVEQVINAEPAGPRTLNPAVPQDLETVCLKCLAKEKSHRYLSAREVELELGRWLAGEPIQARPLGWIHHGWRWCRRRPAVALLSLCSLLLLIGGAVGILWQSQRARVSARVANAARLVAEADRYTLDMTVAHYALKEGDLGRVSELAGQHPDQTGWERRHLSRHTRSDEIATLGFHETTVRLVEFSPDDRLLVSLDKHRITSWDVGERRRIAEVAWPLPEIPSLAFSPSGNLVAVAREDHGHTRIILLDPVTLQANGVELPVNRDPRALDFVDEHRLRVALIGELTEFQLPGGRIQFQHPLPTGFPSTYFASRTLSPDHRYLLLRRRTPAGDEALVWDIAQRQVVQTLMAPGKIVAAAWNPEASRIAFFTELFDLTYHQVAAGTQLWPGVGRAEDIAGLAQDPIHHRLLSGGSDQKITARREADGATEFVLHGHLKRITCLAVSHNGAQIASGSGDRTVRLWANQSPPTADLEFGYPAAGDGVAISDNGRWFTRLGGGNLDVRALPSLSNVYTIPITIHRPWSLAISSDGQRVAVGTEEGSLTSWQTASHKMEFHIQLAPRAVLAVKYSPDDQLLAALTHDGWLRLWRIGSSNLFREWRIGHEMPDSFQGQCEFTPNGQEIATIGADSAVLIWNAGDDRPPVRLEGMKDMPRTLTFAAAAPIVAAADESGRFWLWNYRTGELIWQAEPRGKIIWAMALSPAGDRLLTRTSGGQVCIYDVAARKEVGFLEGDHSLGMTARIRFLNTDQVISAGEREIKRWVADPARE